jgi:dimethylhistidine N-methyltransferase
MNYAIPALSSYLGRASSPAINTIQQSDFNAHFLLEVTQGLSENQKTLPCKYLYDTRGSQLFERICGLEEYYPTRTETKILRRYGHSMADAIGPKTAVIEYGSGASTKTRILLNALRDTDNTPRAYLPIDISQEQLYASAEQLRAEYPRFSVAPVCADYTHELALPPISAKRRIVFFPGSTIGNFDRPQAEKFLSRIARVCGKDGGLLIGVDLIKDSEILHAAYNDSQGVTAEFNLNILHHINRELGANFNTHKFQHDAIWNGVHGRIEMHLKSLEAQTVHVEGRAFHFEAGETILTEYSCKYELKEFGSLARRAGFKVNKVWTDADRLFSVQYLSVR